MYSTMNIKDLRRITEEQFNCDAAQEWIDRQNDREIGLREVDPNRPVVVFGPRMKLNRVQMEGYRTMLDNGWLAYATVLNVASNAYALVCRSDKLWGILYPSGELYRVVRMEFRRGTWVTERTEAQIDTDGDEEVTIPIAAEKFVSAVKKTTRFGDD